MAYRRPPDQASAAKTWAAFLAANRGLIEGSGLPTSCTESREHFDDFLMHGHLDHHADPTRFAVEALNEDQYGDLTLLVEAYFTAGYDWFTPLAVRLPDQQRLRSRFELR
jgi:hypothetical protein